HLRPGAREWFFTWLEHEHPKLLPRYHRMYAASSYASKEYRRWLAERIDPLIDRYGLRGSGDRAHPSEVRRRRRSRPESVTTVDSPAAGLPPPAHLALC